MSSATDRRGFTLLELVVVISMIAILAAVVSPLVFRNVGDARVTATRAQLEALSVSLETYRLDNDYYPSSEQGLAALRRAPSGDPRPRNWRGPYLNKEVPTDGWGRAFIFRSPGTANPASFDLLSYGRDGKVGGTGEDADLESWSNGH